MCNEDTLLPSKSVIGINMSGVKQTHMSQGAQEEEKKKKEKRNKKKEKTKNKSMNKILLQSRENFLDIQACIVMQMKFEG